MGVNKRSILIVFLVFSFILSLFSVSAICETIMTGENIGRPNGCLTSSECVGEILKGCESYSPSKDISYCQPSGSDIDCSKSCTCTCGGYGKDNEIGFCGDGIDNDCDGVADLNDPDCFSACASNKPLTMSCIAGASNFIIPPNNDGYYDGVNTYLCDKSNPEDISVGNYVCTNNGFLLYTLNYFTCDVRTDFLWLDFDRNGIYSGSECLSGSSITTFASEVGLI